MMAGRKSGQQRPVRFTPCSVLLALALSFLGFRGMADSQGVLPDQTPTSAPFGWQVHSGGSVRLLITNYARVGSMPGSVFPQSALPSAQWPGESGIEYLYVGGWWLGARVKGTPRVTTASYGLEFSPGESIASIYETREGVSGGKRFPAADADDDGDGRVDEDWPDGLDNDGDGRVDEDHAAISDQMLACVFNDTSAAISSGSPQHVPLGLHAQQAALAWSRPELDDFVGLDLLLFNASNDTLEDAYVAFFADCDVGPRTSASASADDRARFWEGNVLAALEGEAQNVDLSVAAMYDGDGDGGQTPGVIGFVFLGAETPIVGNPRFDVRNFRMFRGSSSFGAGGDPTNDVERYSCLDGTAPLSLPSPSGTPREELTAAVDSDWRILVSMGPFARIAPQDSLHLAMAIVLGDGFEDMLLNAARAKILYRGVEVDCDGDGQTTDVCPVRWTTPRTVATGVQDLQIVATREDRVLSWTLDAQTQRRLRGIEIQGSLGPEGPFERRTQALLPPSATQFHDETGAPGDGLRPAWYRLALHFHDGSIVYSAAIAAPGETPGTPPVLAVPRPDATGGVEVEFSLPTASDVRLSIHDVSGRMLRLLYQGSLGPGTHRRTWDTYSGSGRPVARGVYLVRLETESTAATRKLLVLRP